MNAADAGWSDFYVATAGAAAALAGLIIVAMSVNIERILSLPSIPPRAASAIGALVATVAASCLGLLPGQPLWLLGLEIAVASAILWGLWLAQLRAVLRDPGHPVARYGVAGLAPVLFSVSAVMLVLGAEAGLYVSAAASVVSIIAGVLFSWIALVEILR